MDRPTMNDRPGDLFPNEELTGYRTQWESIQTGFVDQPRATVEQADALVSQLVTRLTDVFARERSALEGQWTKGDSVSTEDLLDATPSASLGSKETRKKLTLLQLSFYH